MEKMEIFFTEEAMKAFSVLRYSLSNTNTDGYLIGHKRGNLFFIEKLFPSRIGFFSSHKEFFAVKEMFDDKILGFFSFRMTESKMNKILSPVAYGKILVRFDRNKKERWIIKAFSVEHEKDFFLLPIDLKPHNEGRNHGYAID